MKKVGQPKSAFKSFLNNLFLSFRNLVDIKSCQFMKGNSGHTNGILLPKLFLPTVRRNCSSDGEKLLKFEAED